MMTIHKQQVRQEIAQPFKLSRAAEGVLLWLQTFSRGKKILIQHVVNASVYDRSLVYKALKELKSKSAIIHCENQGYVVVKQPLKQDKQEVTQSKHATLGRSKRTNLNLALYALPEKDSLPEAELTTMPHVMNVNAKLQVPISNYST